jgi:hypothetical protein
MDEQYYRQRIKNTIVLLKDGHSFKVGDLTFSCLDNKRFLVTGWTVNHVLENITKQSALNELREIKDIFKNMVLTSPELADFISKLGIEYKLALDYGMGGLEICSETNGQIIWLDELKN